MITPKEIEHKTMSPEKRISAQNDFFAFYIGRPLSYVLTVPFLYTNISPNTVSVISIIPLLIGFVLMCTGSDKVILSIAWLCIFLWFLLDGVDGNIARYKKQYSKMGSVYDAMSGYVAMVLSFFGWGVAAAHTNNIFSVLNEINGEIYIILGALSGISVIFPRLVMHKALSTNGDIESAKVIKDKAEYNTLKLIALNITSISGFVLVFMIIAVWLDLLAVFTLGYFVVNVTVMIVSLNSILNNNERL